MIGYWALVHAGEGSLGISFPDVPGCVAAGQTLERALAQGRDALSAHLAWMRAEGDPIPVARSYAEFLADPETAENARGATWHLVEPRVVQAPRMRVNITIEPGLLREADKLAEAAGTSRSGVIEDALRRRLAADDPVAPRRARG